VRGGSASSFSVLMRYRLLKAIGASVVLCWSRFFGWTVLPTRKFTRWSEEDELRMLELRDAGLT
jgi:hypothetical protein